MLSIKLKKFNSDYVSNLNFVQKIVHEKKTSTHIAENSHDGNYFIKDHSMFILTDSPLSPLSPFWPGYPC